MAGIAAIKNAIDTQVRQAQLINRTYRNSTHIVNLQNAKHTEAIKSFERSINNYSSIIEAMRKAPEEKQYLRNNFSN